MFNVLERELNKDDIAIDLKKLFSKSENFQEKISKRWEELLNLIDKLWSGVFKIFNGGEDERLYK